MPGKKPRNSDKDKDGAVDRGWHLIQNYRKEDPGRHAEEIDFTYDSEEKAPSRFEVPRLLVAEMTTFQEEVVGWLKFGIVSWFNFYFALGGGDARSRLDEASEGLAKTTDRLEAISRQMGNLPWNESEWHDLIMIYAEAVETWAGAIDLVMRGARFDRNNLADEGLQRLDTGSAIAERVVALNSSPVKRVDVDGALRTLTRLQPAGRVSPKTVARAKAPWERALIAAGSPLTWSKSVW